MFILCLFRVKNETSSMVDPSRSLMEALTEANMVILQLHPAAKKFDEMVKYFLP